MRVQRFVIILVTFLCAGSLMAQDFSYIYFQGDKVTPFYVKMDGQMMPRYGKNYCILSELSAGAKNIEILFEKRKYPPQKFTINVPENGFRGFLLNRIDTGFSLYDLQLKKYVEH